MDHKEGNKPVYKKIAVDIAFRIAKGEIKEKTRISGRSFLAGTYNVSPETVRRAVALLQEKGVVTASQGSGIEVLSVAAAEKFIEYFKGSDYIASLKDNVRELLEEHKNLEQKIRRSFNEILDYIERFRNISPFCLTEIEIHSHCRFIGQSVNGVKFWQSTGATVIAYKRGLDVVISPGPEYIFREGDTLVVIGGSNVYENVSRFIYG